MIREVRVGYMPLALLIGGIAPAFQAFRRTLPHYEVRLLSTPRNAARLRASIEQLDAGTGEERELIE
ncbi:hypothetical protein [Pseudooceanicola aestuarii]|uniref:hypothetical protein n=1 Tax=Pseudooceanicola aestuarii TaxID=2697319 RepID=UPI0013D6F6AF|nr:hypothetical protein [Pseudooceanicola aestuarii]